MFPFDTVGVSDRIITYLRSLYTIWCIGNAFDRYEDFACDLGAATATCELTLSDDTSDIISSISRCTSGHPDLSSTSNPSQFPSFPGLPAYEKYSRANCRVSFSQRCIRLKRDNSFCFSI